MSARSLVIAGPPGVGKSTVARALAAKLGMQAVDLDHAILAATKQTPAAIIREDGEAKFREIESRVLSDLPQEPSVIALGGGTLTTAAGRRAARRRGPVLGLSADVDTLSARLVSSGVDRPLLSDASSLPKLIAARERTYAAVDRVIDASGEVSQVAERVARAGEALEVILARVGDATSRVLVGSSFAAATCAAALDAEPSRPVWVIVDRGVPANLRDAYLEPLRARFSVFTSLVAGGETVKTWSHLGEKLEEAVAAGCGRQSVVIGIGGGATCDLAGLAASLLGRGASLILVPTTLLAQIDAAVGGKTAINLQGGRNLVGTFFPARDVLVDTDMLASLDAGEMRSGLAELVKTALIGDAPMFAEVARMGAAFRVQASHLARTIGHKADVVERDPFERGDRKLLNLGHTLAHAIEAASGFTWRHGDAVAVGIAAICRLSAAQGWLPAAEASHIIGVLDTLGLPTSAPRPLLQQSVPFIQSDKKADTNGIDLIVVHAVGKVSRKQVSLKVLDELVSFGGGHSV